MHKHILAAALLLASLSAAAGANPPTAPASQPDNARWQAIIKQLGADDFAVRSAAQKDLDQMTWRQLDFLRHAADTAADPEVKARLAARVVAIEEDQAINPPPISLELKDATTADVADAFSKILGLKLEVWPPHGNGQNFLYTLSAKEKPFWEVFMELARQHPLSLMDIGNQLNLSSQSGQSWRTGMIVGPVAIFPQNITRQRVANIQADQGQELTPESGTLYCQVVIDPRVCLVKYSNPIFTSIVDDVGNVLHREAANAGNLWDVNGHISIQGISASLQIPEKKGTRIVSAKGTFHFVAQTAEEHAVIDDVEKKVGQSFTVAGTSVRVSRFTVQDQPNNNANISMTLDAGIADAAGHFQERLGPNPNAFPAVALTLLDSTGKIAFTNNFRAGSMGASVGGQFTGPYKLRLSIPTKTKDITLPFELKDLPLP